MIFLPSFGSERVERVCFDLISQTFIDHEPALLILELCLTVVRHQVILELERGLESTELIILRIRQY